MEAEQVVCPVCTLFLRAGITLKDHLASHPKQKVIEALVRLSNSNLLEKVGEKRAENVEPQASTSWNQNPVPLNSNFPAMPGNHSFIYQQFMSSTGPQPNVLNVNPLSQQYVTVPTVFNPQMMCSPYVYQQQQVIMSSMPPLIPKPLQLELPEPSQHSPTNQDSSILIQNQESSNLVDLTLEERNKEEEEEIKYEEENKIEEDNNQDFKDIQNEFGSYESENQAELAVESPELNKACQTANQTLNDEKINFNQIEDENLNSNYILSQNFQSNDTTNSLLQNGDLSLIEMDGMKLVLANDFMSNQVISQVDDYECMERPRILMTIGGMDVDNREMGDESVSRESANVRADERMPARGELSGQESNGGASDITWCRVQYNEGSGTSYDLLARETWEGSDESDEELNNHKDQIEISESTFLSPNKCELEEEMFSEQKQSDKSVNLIGCDIGRSKVKKLVIKPKLNDAKEDNFDNVFTNRLKTETDGENLEDPALDSLDSKADLLSTSVLCTTCNEIFANAKALKEHKLEAHNIRTNVRYRCSTCSVVFSSELTYTAHLKIHPLECKLCGKMFYRKQGMQLHLKRHLGIKPYKCSVCDKCFLTKQKHDEHKNIHTGECPIKCSMCDETFKRYSNLIQHRNRHHLNLKKKIKDFMCHCGEVFHSKKKLAWHKEVHDLKPKACTQCSEKFIHAASLTRHMRRAHNQNYVPKEDRNAENVICPICKGVYLKTSLDMHIRNHSGERPYTCPICHKDFTTKWNLKLHKWTHASRTSKPFKCDQCNGAFIRESDYTAHMNSHKSVRPYTCNYCGAQFIRKYNCQRHVKEHEKVKTYSCQTCGKRFHRSYYLKDHMRIHSGVRPYSCNICGKTSTTKSNHNKHVRIHHAREPVSTEN